KGDALLTYHDALAETRTHQIASFKAEKGGGHKDNLHVFYWLKPGQRLKDRNLYWLQPDDYSYLTIEADGKLLYDSPEDVPCDMVEWERVRAEHEREAANANAETPPFHPLAEDYPLMPTGELQRLIDDMKEHGFDARFPIVWHEGLILDGRNRWLAALAAGVE